MRSSTRRGNVSAPRSSKKALPSGVLPWTRLSSALFWVPPPPPRCVSKSNQDKSAVNVMGMGVVVFSLACFTEPKAALGEVPPFSLGAPLVPSGLAPLARVTLHLTDKNVFLLGDLFGAP